MEMEIGTVYLLHFDSAFKHARHYLGWTGNLENRLQQHRDGQGARLMEVVRDAGIGFELARTWTGTRRDERRLHNWKASPRLCPICQARGR